MSRHLTLFLILVFAVFTACAETDDPSSSAIVIVEQDNQLVATVSAEGGVIQGAPGGPFAAFKLEIPKGALNDEQVITVSLIDGTALLPPLAEGIGQPFTIEPAGLALNLPATLTLPVSPERRDAFFSEASECKIWMRDGDGWKNLDQVSSTDTSVTVETLTLNAALSGTFRKNRAILNDCNDVPGATCMTISCNTPGQFCTEQLDPSLSPTLNSSANHATQGKFLFFTSGTGGNTTVRTRVDLDTKAVKTISVTTPEGACFFGLEGFDARPVGDAAGHLWLNKCIFTFDNQPARDTKILSLTSTSPPQVMQLGTPVVTSDGNMVRLVQESGPTATSTRYIQRLTPAGDQLSFSELPLLPSGLAVSAPLLAADPTSPTDVWSIVTLEQDTTSSNSAENSVKGGLVRFNTTGQIATIIEEDPANKLVGFSPLMGVSAVTFASRPDSLVLHGDSITTRSRNSNLNNRLLTGSIAGAQAVTSTLDVLIATRPTLQIIQNLVDSEGGQWLLVANASPESSTKRHVLYIPSDNSKPFFLSIKAQPIQISLASDDRVVIQALPDNSTDKTFYTLRRVK
jgi:hypothetical protein